MADIGNSCIPYRRFFAIFNGGDRKQAFPSLSCFPETKPLESGRNSSACRTDVWCHWHRDFTVPKAVFPLNLRWTRSRSCQGMDP